MIITTVNFILIFLTLITLTPVVFFIVEAIGACLPFQNRHHTQPGSPFSGSIAILVPAHNEGKNLIPTLTNLLEHRLPQTRLIVIADNCDDDTAAQAQSVLAPHPDTQVLSRQSDQRGKGYALEFGIEHLRSQPPDIVIMVDADCVVSRNTLGLITQAAHDTGRPAQALYMMERPPDSPPAQGVAAFAWLVMNRIRMTGLYNLFDVTRLTGSGMAFPFPLLRDHFKGSGNIVEDLALTIELVRLGHPPLLVPDAKVTSQFPATPDLSTPQRARWEQGSLKMMGRNCLPLIRDALAKTDLRMLAIGLDLSIPPLVLLLGLSMGLIGLLLPLAIFGIIFPLILALCTVSLFLITLGCVWLVAGRAALPFSDIGGIITFIAQKARIYGRDGKASTKSWTRTGRE